MQFTIFLAILVLLVVSVIDILRLKIAPTPTSKKVATKLIEMLPKSIDGTIYELGSGFGTLTLKLAKHYPHTKIVAFEKAIVPFVISKLLFGIYRIKNVELRFKDFRKESFKGGQYFICYLYRQIMPFIAKKIESEVIEACWLISHTFEVLHRDSTQLAYSKDLYNTPIYFYQFIKK